MVARHPNNAIETFSLYPLNDGDGEGLGRVHGRCTTE